MNRGKVQRKITVVSVTPQSAFFSTRTLVRGNEMPVERAEHEASAEVVGCPSATHPNDARSVAHCLGMPHLLYLGLRCTKQVFLIKWKDEYKGAFKGFRAD
jgi:hypothetical protein